MEILIGLAIVIFSVKDSGVINEVKPYYAQQAEVSQVSHTNREFRREVEQGNWTQPEPRLYTWDESMKNKRSM
jgi:hypothetical protein